MKVSAFSNQRSATRPAFDRPLAATGLLVLSPMMALIAAAIVLESGFPVLFRQVRIGRWGRPFHLLKFRSMAVHGAGTRITAAGDPRVTRVGRLLRRYKLDELPQLWNVVRGDMSLIGPRPEVPSFVDLESPIWQTVLAVRPGISDVATLVYRNEEETLAAAADPERFYREAILPDKLELNVRYLGRRSFERDCKLLYWTVRYSLAPSGFKPEKVRRLFS